VILRYVVVGLAAGALLGALAVYLALRWYRERTGFASGGSGTGRIIASDTGVEASILLRDPQLGLRGRPDYLLEFEVAGHPLYVPLELKPGRRSRRIYESDALQVAAYLIALRATTKDAAATFGYLRYATGTFKVGLTEELERRVQAIVQAIRAGRSANTVHRSHTIVQRCVGCSVREHCNEALR
jgi:CRISPR/Cas system-associated exonuclease Cas4 (RecB family)